MLADGDLTATKFNAEARVKLFQQTFKHIHIDEVSSFAIAQVADSTDVNPYTRPSGQPQGDKRS